MSRNDTLHVFYFNGLGSGKTRHREQLAFRYLAKHGIEVTHAPIDWRSDEPFPVLFERMTKLTQQELKKHGKLILVGSSAGGSLAINILGRLHDKNISAITLCSRLRLADLPWWDRRSLKRKAYLGTPLASQSFFDSVTYCSKTTIPKLTKQDKAQIVIVQQWADFVVPRQTMSIEGVQTYGVPALGHGWGIATGVRRLPEVVKLLGLG